MDRAASSARSGTPSTQLVAGVDSSTTATKVEVRELDSGRIVGRGSAPHPPTQPPRSEQHPDAWWTAFEAAWQLAGAPPVAAVSVAGQQHGMVALDAQRRVIRPAKLWNDTESAPDAAWLVDRLPGGRSAWVAACGLVPVASFTITKLSWLHRCEPDAWARLAHVVLPHDWITARMTGRLATDRGDASGTGYWSAATGTYRDDLLALVEDRDWSTVVPPVLGPTEAAGAWQGAVVGPGTGDNMAGALGVGLRPGDVAISIGTSGTVYTVSDTPTTDPSGIVAGFADASGRHLPLVCTLNATKVTDAVARLLGVDHDGLDALALAAAPGARGLSLLPYLDGERTPDRPTATGVLTGLRSDVTREQLARAAVEGVVCGLLDGLDALGAHAPVDGRLLLGGGGAHSRAYRQVLADLAGRPVVVPRGDQQVATGACVQAAAVAVGADPADIADIADRWGLGAGDLVEPGPGATAAADVRAAYAAVRDATAST
jgi:xylulokinase